jgi:hypothetical protein
MIQYVYRRTRKRNRKTSTAKNWYGEYQASGMEAPRRISLNTRD